MPLNNFNRYPYNDDFNEDNMYYRLLFQPGRAVQARELTQIQTLLQSQIGRFGSHVFKEGSLVIGGEISFDRTNHHHLKLKPQDPYGKPVAIRDVQPGMVIKKSSQAGGSSITAPNIGRITHILPAEDTDPDTILFTWDSGGPETGSDGFGPSENLVICDSATGVVKYTVTTVDRNPSVGNVHYGPCCVFSVQPGIYYWKGMFLKSHGGSLVLSKYAQDPTYRIGYTVNEQIEQNDSRSFDPASDTTNYAAPGADRYRITLDLINIGDGVTSDTNFQSNYFDIAKIDSGLLLTSPQDQTLYNQLAKEFAKRTFEESGNYVSQPYKIRGGFQNKTTKNGPDMVASLSSGISYVGGYRNSLSKQHKIFVPKGRDVAQETVNIDNAYGDNFLYMYDYANNGTGSTEDANGLFTVGSGGGDYTANDWYGRRGEEVSLHCVPHKYVTDYSLANEHKWRSTLVGTARPIQMFRNPVTTKAAHQDGRPGEVYQLWLGDVKSSPVINTISVTNVLYNVRGVSNSTFVTFLFDPTVPDPVDSTVTVNQQEHGLTANDKISIVGAEGTLWNVNRAVVNNANSIAINIFDSTLAASLGATSPTDLTLHRTTANASPYKSVVLQPGHSPEWNGAYIGATITVANCVPRKIIDYIGTDSHARHLYETEDSSVEGKIPGFPDSGYSRFGWNKPATVIFDRDLVTAKNGTRYIPKKGDSYTIHQGIKQARSAVHNYNVNSANGQPLFPARVSTAWNVDTTSGIINGDPSLRDSTIYGNRIDGETTFNRTADNIDLSDALIFKTNHAAVKQVLAHSDSTTVSTMDKGLKSNTTVYYTEYTVKTCSADQDNLTFAPATAGNYKFFLQQPEIYPYQPAITKTIDTSDHSTTKIAERDEIRNNFQLVDQVTGEVLTPKIKKIVVRGMDVPNGNQVDIYLTENFVDGKEYVLIYPVKAIGVKPAYKKLVTANVTHSTTRTSQTGSTDYSRGQVEIQDGTYGIYDGARIKLDKPDGFRLRKVVKLEDASGSALLPNVALASTDSAVDITNRFYFDNGQRDMFYDNASIVFKPQGKYDTPSGNLVVCFDYFQRMDKEKSDSTREENLYSPSYFSVDSYQWTTDLLLRSVTPEGASSFTQGQKVEAKVTGSSGTAAYVVDYANTGGGSYAKLRVNDVQSATGTGFVVGETITAGDTSAVIHQVTTQDVTYADDPTQTLRGIPSYTSPSSGQTYLLRNHLDFRPYVSTNNRTSDTISSSFMPPIPTHSGIKAGKFQSSYSDTAYNAPAHPAGPMKTEAKIDAYLGRIDKIISTADGTYELIKGTPSKQPKPPRDYPENEALTIFEIQIPAYTPDPAHVQYVPNLAMRHTMKDISRLAKRVENIEYYVALTALEKSAESMIIKDVNGNELFKNGIVVDDFTSTKVSNKKVLGQFSVGRGVLKPAQLKLNASAPFGIGAAAAAAGEDDTDGIAVQHFTAILNQRDGVRFYEPGVEHGGSEAMLDWEIDEESPAIQPWATSMETINPFHLKNYHGNLKISPDTDKWFSTDTMPTTESYTFNSPWGDTLDISDQTSPEEIKNWIDSIDGFWEYLGSVDLGNNIQGTVFDSVGNPGTYEYQSQSQEIQLGSLSMFTNRAVDLITTHLNSLASNPDGQLGDISIMPYIRQRDIALHASGMKPHHPAVTLFDESLIEDRVSRANQILIRNDTITGGEGSFRPQTTGAWEKIQLTSSTGLKANAMLIAVRSPAYRDVGTEGNRAKVGYIIPCFDRVTGKVPWSTHKDGFYNSTWNDGGSGDTFIKVHGFQGTDPGVQIKGFDSGVGAFLWSDENSIPSDHNGHYTGLAMNGNIGDASTNTTHLVLSPDAHRYVANNFGNVLTNEKIGIGKQCLIKIVSGSGAGRQFLANNFYQGSSATKDCHVIEIDPQLSSENALDSTSVYTIGMKPVDFRGTSREELNITQIGCNEGLGIAGGSNHTNAYGDKIGVLHLPSETKKKFEYGRKLIEVIDRHSREPWLVNSYASAYYYAEGQTKTYIDNDDRDFQRWHFVRNQLDLYQLPEYPEADETGEKYIPAKNLKTNKSGKLAVVLSVELDSSVATAGDYTGTDLTPSIPYIAGEPYGSAYDADQNQLRKLVTGVWDHIRETRSDIYNKYFSVWEPSVTGVEGGLEASTTIDPD